MIISFPATVTDVFERKFTKHLGGAGPEARFHTGSAGWYVQIDGMVSIFVGHDKPDFEIDEAIVMTLRKAK